MSSIGSFIREIWEIIATVDTNSTIMVDGLNFKDDECVYINKYHRELYCIELVSTSNIQEYFEDIKVNHLFETFCRSQNGYFYEVHLKNEDYQRTYIFANNKKLLTMISRYLDSNFLKFDEIINVLYDLFLENNYPIKEKIQTKETKISDSIRYENISNAFSKVVKESVYRNFDNVTLFQAYAVEEERDEQRINFTKLFKQNWHGAIFTYVDMREESVLLNIKNRKRKSYLDGDREEWTGLADDVAQGKETLCVVNSVALLKGDTSAISEISECLGISYKRKDILKRQILKYLPLIKRDTYWDCLVGKKFMYGFIGVTHKENLEKPDWYAKDLMGNYWNYSFDATTPKAFNKNANILALGVSGSGKTTNINGILAQILGYDVKTNSLKYLDQNYIRDFDIKKSGKILRNIVHRIVPNEVRSLKADLNHFVFNPLNISVEERGNRVFVDKNELSMNVSLLSLALEAKTNIKDRSGLDTSEQLLLERLITSIYEDRTEVKGSVWDLKNEGRIDLYEELKQIGYDDSTPLQDIKENRYAFLKKPTLDMVMKRLAPLASSEKNIIEKNIMESLESKLKIIKEMRIFSGYDSLNLDASIKYLYMDFDDIKDIPEYAPIFLAIFNKMYREDKRKQDWLKERGLPRPTIYYKFEECRNLFLQPSFKAYLDKFNNEARSYGIRILFITQLIEHVPAYIYTQIQNLLLLFPNKSRKQQLIDVLVEALKPSEEVIEMFRKTNEYDIAVYNEHGCSIVHLPLSKEEIALYGQSM